MQEQLLDRMIGCLKALFTTEVPNPNINMKEVQRAFSILVNIPKVTEKFELPVSIFISFNCRAGSEANNRTTMGVSREEGMQLQII